MPKEMNLDTKQQKEVKRIGSCLLEGKEILFEEKGDAAKPHSIIRSREIKETWKKTGRNAKIPPFLEQDPVGVILIPSFNCFPF